MRGDDYDLEKLVPAIRAALAQGEHTRLIAISQARAIYERIGAGHLIAIVDQGIAEMQQKMAQAGGNERGGR